MPKRKAAEHQNEQETGFTSDGIKATSDVWYAVLARQPDWKFWLSTCEQIASNLWKQWVSVYSIRGADEVAMKAVTDAAFTGMTPKLGPQIVLKRVLEDLRQGSATAIHHGKGQAIANVIFWEFQVDMVGKYGDAALEWFGRLSHKADREAEVARILDDTWALICDKPDAMHRYGRGNICEKGYNYELTRLMKGIFLEAKEEKQKVEAA